MFYPNAVVRQIVVLQSCNVLRSISDTVIWYVFWCISLRSSEVMVFMGTWVSAMRCMQCMVV